MASRLPQLDFLRGASIFLVLGVHHHVSAKWNQIGWMGVDIFFVLSGFLVSGLLFNEYKKKGTVHVGRFLLRRGLKIYPMFYFFVMVTVFVRLVGHRAIGLEQIAIESLYLQNYLKGLWLHTWSLAIEEHFYFLLAVLVFCLGLLRTHLKWLIPVIFLINILCLLLRIYTVHLSSTGILVFPSLHEKFMRMVSPTHLRIDSLFFGVLLSFIHTFHGEKYAQWIQHYRLLLVALLVGLCTFVSGFYMFHPFTLTFGFTINYLTFGLLLMLLVYQQEAYESLRRMPLIGLPIKALEKIGLYSYGIYLWHLPVEHWIILPMQQRHIGNHVTQIVVYFVLSVGVGVVTTHLLERPVLRLREKYFAQ